MIGLSISQENYSSYKDIIRYDIKRRYKKAKVNKSEREKVEKRILKLFTHGCKFLPELYEKLKYTQEEMMFLRIDLIEEYLERAKKQKDLSYRKLIDQLYQDTTFWSFMLGLWIERDIVFQNKKIGYFYSLTTGEKQLVYTEHYDTGFIYLKDEFDLRFFYEAYHRRILRTMEYECIKFIKKYINKLEKNVSSTMEKKENSQQKNEV